MKTIGVPINVFESGDRVLTPDGMGTVIYDSLNLDASQYNSEVSLRMDSDPTGDIVKMDRVYLILN